MNCLEAEYASNSSYVYKNVRYFHPPEEASLMALRDSLQQ
jgi:hypothetical protein